MIVRNKCIQCKHKWKDQAGAAATVLTTIGYNEDGTPQRKALCPKCGSIYFKWSSYDFDRKKYKENFDPGDYKKLNKF